MGCNYLKAMQNHYEDTVYFLPEIPGKGEMTLKPSSGFELEYQPSYYQIIITKSQYVKLTQLWPLTVNYRPNDYTIEISVLPQIQFYNIFTNVPSIIFENCQ